MRTRRRSPAARRRRRTPKPRRGYVDVCARRAASVEPTWLHRTREGPPARSVPTATTRAPGRHRPGTVVVAFRCVEPLAGAQATAMRQEIADGGLVVRYPGEVARDRCVELHVAGVDELQHRQSCEGLGDGPHRQRRISGERPAGAVGPREVLGLDSCPEKGHAWQGRAIRGVRGFRGPTSAGQCLRGQPGEQTRHRAGAGPRGVRGGGRGVPAIAI